MPVPRQIISISIGEALALIARQKYSTAKQLARAWNIDVSTAENVFKGHASIRSLQSATNAEGWGIWDAIGETVMGESRDAAEERALRKEISDREGALEKLAQRRARREALERRTASLDDDLSREGSAFHG